MQLPLQEGHGIILVCSTTVVHLSDTQEVEISEFSAPTVEYFPHNGG